MKFAFIIMGNYDSRSDKAEICGGNAQIIGVSTLNEAVEVAKELQANGVGCIELCGAFGESGAKKIIDATKNMLPVGYVTHLPEQDGIYASAFGGDGK